ncbi:MAG: amidohydrolase family protein [Candidatus Latescibacteria bacterium]|nr:amidohydrolase family protein [Candidatus Latescibacterota bacterium]
MSPDLLAGLRQLVRPPFPALDVHVHPLACFGPHQVASVAADAQLLRAAAQRAGVEKMCLFSLHADCPREPTPQQLLEANDYTLAMRREAPDFFLPFCYVSPQYPEQAVAEIDRCVAGEGMVGVKLWVARRAIDPGLDPIVERAVELGVPLLQHAWRKTTGNLVGESFPADVAILARRHPRAQFIMAHLNGCNPRGLEAVVDCANIHVDISGGDPESCMVAWAVERLGPGRVVYGSDAPIRHLAVSLAKVLAAPLTAADRRAILWNNAAGLLPSWAGVEPLPEEN